MMRRRLLLLVSLVPLAACADGTGGPPLVDITTASRIDFVHELRATGEYRIPEVLGSGCAVFDADGDGRVDLYFVNAGDGPGDGAPNRLFLRQPDGTYADGTEASGLGDAGFGTGTALGDVDNDGDLDLVVGNWGPDALYRNEGDGRFVRVAGAGIEDPRHTSSLAFLDYDADGFLDLFVVRYVNPDVLDDGSAPTGQRDYLTPSDYPHLQDTLYRNRGDGTFEDVNARVGIVGRAAPPPAAGLGVWVEDLTGDGYTDVLVTNDAVRNHLWVNAIDVRFREEAVSRGLAFNLSGSAEASMGIAVGDANGDGERDILMTHVTGETNTLYRGRDGGWMDDSGRSGIALPSIHLTGWGASLFDLEHDGDLDLMIVNGAVWRLARPYPGPTPAPWGTYAEPNHLFLGDGAGAFADISPSVDGLIGRAESSRALAVADLDGDGDLDAVVTNVGGAARLYENTTRKMGNALVLRAIDPELGRDALGARIEVGHDTGVRIAVVTTTGGYMSSVPPVCHVGIGDDLPTWLAVVWPGGEREEFDVPSAGTPTELRRGEGRKP